MVIPLVIPGNTKQTKKICKNYEFMAVLPHFFAGITTKFLKKSKNQKNLTEAMLNVKKVIQDKNARSLLNRFW